MTAVGFESVVVLPGGRIVSDHPYVKGLPSTSVDALPSSVTVCATSTDWSGPALATGAELRLVTVTGSAALVVSPSDTTSCSTKEPGRSATNVGFTTFAPLKA